MERGSPGRGAAHVNADRRGPRPPSDSPRPRGTGRPGPREGGPKRSAPRTRERARPTTARAVALDALARIEEDGAYANLVTPTLLERSGLSDLDRRFVTELVYGTTRMRRACDFAIDRFILSPPDPDTRRLLRLGAYQLLFAGVAPHAAVGETVELAPSKVRGFVNAVLRRVANAPVDWPDDATRLSYPDWIVRRLDAEFGVETSRSMLESMNQPAPVHRREDGYVQDLASQAVVDAVVALLPTPDALVYDVCAAPGGKTTGMAGRGATVVAGDLHLHRARLTNENVAALGAELAGTVVADGTMPPFRPGAFDAVLLDAPCSGLGCCAAVRTPAGASPRPTSPTSLRSNNA
ncbi:MAG: transcription antitermination factor NusB [Ilumatobacteraceae bacterium]